MSRVDHTPGGTNAAAGITVSFNIITELEPGVDTIAIEFDDDVKIPDILAESSISIVDHSAGNVASPLYGTVERFGVPADETRVTLTIPDMTPSDQAGANTALTEGQVSVIFRQSGGIKNPSEAGTLESQCQDVQRVGECEEYASQ